MGISFAEPAAPAICPQNQLSAEKTLFGYIKPNIPELRVREKARYDAWYCGLCRRLGARYGTAARALLSFDCTFLALLAASVSGEDSPEDLLRCPFKPFGKKRAMARFAFRRPRFCSRCLRYSFRIQAFGRYCGRKAAANCRKTPPALRIQKSTVCAGRKFMRGKKAYGGSLPPVEAPYRGSRAFPRRQSRKERFSG